MSLPEHMGSKKCLGKRKIEGWEDPYQKKKNSRSIIQTSSLKYGERGEQMKPACSEWRKWWRLRLRVMEQRTEKQKKVDKNQTLIHSTDPHNRLIFIQTDEVGDSDNRRCYNWSGGVWLPTAQTQGGRKQNSVDVVLQQISVLCS